MGKSLFFPGTKKDLSTYSVSPAGVLCKEPAANRQEPKLASRRQEVERERLRQVNAQAHNFQGVAERLVQGGPGAWVSLL